MVTDRDKEFRKRLISAFRIEAKDHVATISQGLATLELENNSGNIVRVTENIFRATHSLKGASRAVDMIEIESLCRALENIFAIWKERFSFSDRDYLKEIHIAVDALSDLLVSSDRGKTADLIEMVHSLSRISDSLEKRKISYESENAIHSEHNSGPYVNDRGRSFDLDKMVEPSSLIQSGEERENGEAIDIEAEDTIGERVRNDDFIRISSSKLEGVLVRSEEMMTSKFSAGESVEELRSIAGLFDGIFKDKKFRQEQPEESQLISTIKGKLEDLLTTLEGNYHSFGLMLELLQNELRESLMMPCSQLMEMVPKMVRDLARDQSKEITVTVSGAELEVDRRVLDRVKDPLVHMLRNAVDHGIETPDKRVLCGKERVGRISISISLVDSDKLEITVSDDGKGMDIEALKASAVKSGSISRKDADSLDTVSAEELAFLSGITTSPVITDISGRGLGLAIVQENIERLGGTISVKSSKGKGISFRFQVPVTLTSFRGIFIRCGGQVFVVPTVNVEKVMRLKVLDIERIENREVIVVDGKTVPFARLKDALRLPDVKAATETGENRGRTHAMSGNERGSYYEIYDHIHILLTRYGSRKVAFAVDEVLREDEGLLKNLGSHLQRVKAVSGAAVYGKGNIAPVLHVPDLMECAKDMAPRKSGASSSDGYDYRKKAVLIAEDSATSRMLLKNIVESGGYEVGTAVDGLDALTVLKEKKYDLLVSDVDMPKMNGFILTETIRSEELLSDLPVILVTARDSREDRERGVDVGANAYIAKSGFDQSNLLDVIRRFV